MGVNSLPIYKLLDYFGLFADDAKIFFMFMATDPTISARAMIK